jgi:hypothetical protein
MCMNDEKEMEVADGNIICWKVMELCRISDYSAPKRTYAIHRKHRSEHPVKGGLQKAKGFPRSAKSQKSKEGGFYAYLTEKTARREKKEMCGKLVLLKCLVPKGTRIIKGWQGWDKQANALRAEYMIHGVA